MRTPGRIAHMGLFIAAVLGVASGGIIIVNCVILLVTG
jgi:hypothetical protein